MDKKILTFDTTLRDGGQSREVTFSLADKLAITKELDKLGVSFIEGGWPGANPVDTEYFRKVKKLSLKNATIVAFGSTHNVKFKVEDDPNVAALIAAKTKVITIFGKTWDFHVEHALKVSLEKNLELIRSTISYLRSQSRSVFFDAEHFFDGFKNNADYALKCLETAQRSGADYIILCDTNGGSFPLEIASAIGKVRKSIKIPLGIHAHNDGELAVANTLAAVNAGVRHIQGTVNGLGERCGNANLCSVIPNLELKLGFKCLPSGRLTMLKEMSVFIDEITSLMSNPHLPFVGQNAFAHKGGIHIDAVLKNPMTYEHISPEKVGNRRKTTASSQAGGSTILEKAREFGIKLEKGSPELAKILKAVKDLESKGFEFAVADASLELLMRKVLNNDQAKKFFTLSGFRVITEKRQEGEMPYNEATIEIKVDGHSEHTASRGNGPVDALDKAFRKAIEKFYPKLKRVELLDYKVKTLTGNGQGTASLVRVLITFGNGSVSWSTIWADENIIRASWRALVEGYEYFLLKNQEK